MACFLPDDGRPPTVAQMFAYVRHRYADLRAYYLPERDLIAIPLAGDLDEAVSSLRELAARKGLACSEVSAAWPELVGPELAGREGAHGFLVISGIDGERL